jgi:hypothetical protein
MAKKNAANVNVLMACSMRMILPLLKYALVAAGSIRFRVSKHCKHKPLRGVKVAPSG